MNVRHLFGKPLPAGLTLKKPAISRSWITTLTLFTLAGLTAWVVKTLMAKDAKEAEEMIYFWPE